MAFSPEVKTMAAVGVTTGTASELQGSTKKIPNGVWCLETDTGYMKVGDGLKTYSQLPYKIQEALLPEWKTMLQKVNQADGVLKLDASGKVTMDQLPSEIISDALTGNIVYVADIAARDLLTDPKKSGLVIVMDATADPTVSRGSAAYTWQSQEEGAEEGGAWLKILEFESMDIDFDTILGEYFKFTGDSANTLDDIQDGTTYIKMESAWKTSVDSDLTDLKSRLGTAESDIDAVEGRLATAESDITGVKGRLDTAEGSITSQGGRLTTAEGEIDTLQSDLAELQTSVGGAFDGSTIVYLKPVTISELEAVITE